MKSYEPGEFIRLREDIESHPRLCGYYIIKLVDIHDLRMALPDDEAIAEAVFRHFDDHAWPPDALRPKDQCWADYATDQANARIRTAEALVGGRAVGHLEPTISAAQAQKYFDRFDGLFDAPRKHYVGLGLGDQKYVFSGGVAIISSRLAGCLWVVESD